jgi:hypothetical protein
LALQKAPVFRKTFALDRSSPTYTLTNHENGTIAAERIVICMISACFKGMNVYCSGEYGGQLNVMQS